MRAIGRVNAWVVAWVAVVLTAALLTVTPGCGRAPERAPGPLRVAVTIAPLAGLVRAVAPEDAEVRAVIPAGASPHGYQPTPSDAELLRRADLVVAVGLGVEGGLATAIERGVGGSDRSLVFADVVGLEGHGHDHAGHDGHDRGSIDPHLWLDPGLVLQLVEALERELGVIDPDDAAVIAVRADVLSARIRELDAELERTLAPVRGRAVVTDHDAFGRFCERYGLRVVAIVRPFEGAEPTPGELEAVRGAIERDGVGGVFIEPQFDGRAAHRLAETGGVPVGTLDPIAGEDWFAMMRANAGELARVLGEGSP